MKVLHVINSLVAAGAEKLVSSLAVKQSVEHEVAVFTFDSSKDIFSEFNNSSVKFHTTGSNKYYSFTNLKALFKLIKEYQIIHVHLFPSFYLAALLSFFFTNQKFIYTEHNTHNRRREKIFLKPLEKLVYSRYIRIICITESVKQELEKWIGDKPNKIVIHNFIDIQDIKSKKPYTKESLGFKETDRLLVMVGRFCEQKDQLTILRALMLLSEEYKLVLIGEGSYRNKLENFINENELTRRVMFLGVRKDVFSILKACDYGIQSSHWEGFGIAALEYMACDLPTFGSNVNGLNEVIPIKGNLFIPANHVELKDKILALDLEKNRKSAVVKYQNEFIINFDITKATSKHLQLYKKIIKN